MRRCKGATVRGIAAIVCAFIAVIVATAATQDSTVVTNPPERFATRVLASGLEGPWEVAWGPDQQLWVTERTGRRVVRINPADGSRSVAVTIPEVNTTFTQDGLLGLVFHADLMRGSGNDFVYVAFTYDDAAGPALARRLAVRRYRYNQTARAPRRAARYPDGSSDAYRPRRWPAGLRSRSEAVSHHRRSGQQLRREPLRRQSRADAAHRRAGASEGLVGVSGRDPPARSRWSDTRGTIAEIGGVRSHVFSVGHRNPLGLAFGPNGRLYESEHGPSSDDEANLIESGRNYGWPNVAGYKDGKAYLYANWSASSPTPCDSLPRGGGDAIPPSVPQQPESTFNHPQFTPPLRTFFTVETGYDLSRIGSATIAPGGLDVYTGDGIPGWKNSLLVLSLIRGAVYRLSLAPDGRSIQSPPSELFKSANRYRDIALNPDGWTLYLATDASGPSRDACRRCVAEARQPGEHLW